MPEVPKLKNLPSEVSVRVVSTLSLPLRPQRDECDFSRAFHQLHSLFLRQPRSRLCLGLAWAGSLWGALRQAGLWWASWEPEGLGVGEGGQGGEWGGNSLNVKVPVEGSERQRKTLTCPLPRRSQPLLLSLDSYS